MCKGPKDITGQKFGKLTAIKFLPTEGKKRSRWLCRCDCGNEKEVGVYNLTNYLTVSCGCLRSSREYSFVVAEKVEEFILETDGIRLYSAAEIAKKLDAHTGTVSTTLIKLLRKGIVEDVHEGKRRYWRKKIAGALHLAWCDFVGVAAIGAT